MARQRFIHPELWKDPMFGKLQPVEQVLFIGLFSIADDEGRLMADAAYLRAEIFPYKDYTNKKVQTIRDGVLAKAKNVRLYTVASIDYIVLLKWHDYQKPKYPKESKLPEPLEQDSPNDGEGFPESGATGRAGLGLGWEGLDRAGMGAADENREERLREVGRILALVNDADENSETTLMVYATKLPLGAVAKVRESGQTHSQRRTLGVGWFVNALKSELEPAA